MIPTSARSTSDYSTAGSWCCCDHDQDENRMGRSANTQAKWVRVSTALSPLRLTIRIQLKKFRVSCSSVEICTIPDFVVAPLYIQHACCQCPIDVINIFFT